MNLVFQKYIPESNEVGAVKITVNGNNVFVCDAFDLEVLYTNEHQVLGLRMKGSYRAIEPKYNYQTLELVRLSDGVMTLLYASPVNIAFVEHEDCIADIIQLLKVKKEKAKKEADKAARKFTRFITFGLFGKEPVEKEPANDAAPTE